MSASTAVDLSNAEPVEWTIEGKEGRTRIRLADGSVLDVRNVIVSVMRVGNDPVSGLPLYNVNMQPSMSLVRYDKSQRKRALKQPGLDKAAAAAGFA